MLDEAIASEVKEVESNSESLEALPLQICRLTSENCVDPRSLAVRDRPRRSPVTQMMYQF